MHGDYLYQLCFAFQRYTRYYTWDKTYNAMFNNLRCNFPMTIYKPDKLKGIAEKIDNHECRYFATYYFSDETKESAKKIYKIFKAFSDIGLRCKIRPHPRFSDISMLLKVFSDIEIENFKAYSLSDSIRDSMYIIGLNTTVLSEGYFSGKNIVIDNMSMEARYLELKNKGYIMMSRPHLLLSELADSVKNKQFYDENYKFKMS